MAQILGLITKYNNNYIDVKLNITKHNIKVINNKSPNVFILLSSIWLIEKQFETGCTQIREKTKMNVMKPAIERDALVSFEGIDCALDKVLKLKLGDVEIPDIEFVEYQPGLRENVLIHLLFDNTKDDPKGSDAALIKYLPGAYVPRHLHIGYEMVLVLKGEYIENDVIYRPGSLLIRAPGTTHEMRSNEGCVILAMRDIPVKQLT